MGMLMHHTWLEEQKKANAKPVSSKPEEKPVDNKEPEAEQKKTAGRRKVSK